VSLLAITGHSLELGETKESANDKNQKLSAHNDFVRFLGLFD
jgi:hypothetical protein